MASHDQDPLLDQLRTEADQSGLGLGLTREAQRAESVFDVPISAADCWKATLHKSDGELVVAAFGATGAHAARGALMELHEMQRRGTT
jgi:hypothetical protein